VKVISIGVMEAIRRGGAGAASRAEEGDAILEYLPVRTLDPIATLIAAVRALSPDVCDASVMLLPSGSASVRVMTRDAAAATRIAADLGCAAPTWVSDGRSEWICAERDEDGELLSLTVTGGHRPVCQCEAARAARGAI
jgi:hypothetical protein